jgi:hypothetical protein
VRRTRKKRSGGSLESRKKRGLTGVEEEDDYVRWRFGENNVLA